MTAKKGQNRNKKKSSIKLNGHLTVQNAADLRESLVTKLSDSRNLSVVFKDVKGADLTILQLICSTHKTALESGKSVTFKEQSIPEVVQDLAIQAGFTDRFCSVQRPDCLWTSLSLEQGKGQK